MVSRFKPSLPSIKEPIQVRVEKTSPFSIINQKPRIRGGPPFKYDAHGNLVRLPVKTNSARRSRKRRKRKNKNVNTRKRRRKNKTKRTRKSRRNKRSKRRRRKRY